jgi:hypothetical protein
VLQRIIYRASASTNYIYPNTVELETNPASHDAQGYASIGIGIGIGIGPP